MVAFRGEDGKAGVLHAFCPHLGTHLGHGGTVAGNHLVCPYHSWEFTADGTNKCIPYCSKDMTGSKRVNAQAYEVRERLVIVFVWYHAGNKAPEYELTILDEVEGPEFRHIISEDVGTWGVHVMEPSHNSADWYHFHTVHKWMGQDDTEVFKFLKIKQHMNVRYGTEKKYAGKIEPTVLELDEDIAELKLFGFVPLPHIFHSVLTTRVRAQGAPIHTIR